MSATNINNEQLQTELLERGRDRDALRIGRVNKERLGQFLGEIQRKEDTEDRYKAALRGETLTGTPDAKIRGGGGTSVEQQKQGDFNQNSGNLPKSNPQLVVPEAAAQGPTL